MAPEARGIEACLGHDFSQYGKLPPSPKAEDLGYQRLAGKDINLRSAKAFARDGSRSAPAPLPAFGPSEI